VKAPRDSRLQRSLHSQLAITFAAAAAAITFALLQAQPQMDNQRVPRMAQGAQGTADADHPADADAQSARADERQALS
jgi:hypothetical protein